MLTEEGSIKTENIEVAPALNLYRKKLKIIALIALIIGVLGVIMYIVGSALETAEDGKSPVWVKVFLFFAVPLALGLIGYITIIRLNKREKAEVRTSECLFFEDCFFYTTKIINQPQTVEKILYSDAVYKGEKDKYGYIFVLSRGLFLVFSKEGLQGVEINAIRKNFGQTTDGESAELKNYESNN